ncbi:MAG TPA: TonB-dependent receptor [Chitinophagaceae bacterium]
MKRRIPATLLPWKTGLVCALVLLFHVRASAQTTPIKGRVTDAAGTPIVAAWIEILNTNVAAYSTPDGTFRADLPAPGKYSLAVSAAGYATSVATINILASTGEPVTIVLHSITTQLDEVVVTAVKRAQEIQDVHPSISALNAKAIDEFQLWHANELTGIVPNLYASNPGDGRNVISIRGITSSSYDPAVTTYIDGVNQFTLDTYIPQLFDVDRIEVLRGPQGTLYGRNAMGGVINIITHAPSNEINGFIRADIGNAGLQRYTASVSGPLQKNRLFFGVAGLAEVSNGFFTNEFNNTHFDKQQHIGADYMLRYIASKKFSLTADVKHLSNLNRGAFSLAPGSDAAFANPFRVDQNAIAHLSDHNFNASLSGRLQTAHVHVDAQVAWQSNYRFYHEPIDADFSPIDGITIINNYGHPWNRVSVFTEEVRLSSPAASAHGIKWLAGLYSFQQQNPNKQATHFGKDAALVGSPDSNYAIINTTKLHADGLAAYGDATYAVSNRIEISAGMRVDYQRSKESVLGEYQPDASPTPVFETQPDTSAAKTFHAVSPSASIGLLLTKSIHLYLNYSRGFRTGGLTQLGADPGQPPLYAYKPEHSDNFEVSWKSVFFDRRLNVNWSVFATSIRDVQVPTLVLPAAVTITRNAGKLSSHGADADIIAAPLRGLETQWSIGYTHATFHRLLLSSNGSEADLAGNRQIFSPDVTSMLAAQYSLSLDQKQRRKMFVRAEWLYLGQEYFDLANTIRQAPHQLFNARTGVVLSHMEIDAWIRNAFDSHYIAFAYDFGGVHLGDPRTYGVSIKLSLR